MLDTIQFSFCKTNIWIKFEEPVNTHTVNKCWDSHYFFLFENEIHSDGAQFRIFKTNILAIDVTH